MKQRVIPYRASKGRMSWELLEEKLPRSGEGRGTLRVLTTSAGWTSSMWRPTPPLMTPEKIRM